MHQLLSPSVLRSRFEPAVHESAQQDPLIRAQHHHFIVSHILGGGLALIAFPFYIAFIGGLTLLSVISFAWLVSPIIVALYLSKTGRLAESYLLSAANLAALVTFAAGLTGGLNSFILPWMIIVPLEAALSGNRRVVYSAIAIAGLGLAALAAGTYMQLLPTDISTHVDSLLLGFCGAGSALFYAGGLAVSVQQAHDRSSEAVRESESRYRLLAENATDLITRHSPEGNVVFASSAAENIFHVAPDELTGDGFVARIHPSDRNLVRTALTRSANESLVQCIQFRLDNVTLGTVDEMWAEMRIQPIEPGRDNSERANALVAVTRDITQHKAQEMALLQARDAAESASRAKTQFLATMSHELRTPLNAIIGFADILKRELFGAIGEDRYRDYARLIHESGDHLLSVVNEILDMSKIEAGKYALVTEPFAVAPFVDSCAELMMHQASEKSIVLSHGVERGLPDLTADRRACKQMLLNLLSNALKFTEPGGEVKISVSASDGFIRLQVADNGIGIAPDDLASLGNPFVQVETNYARKFEGAGLGLCVVKGLAHLHGGTLDIDSEVGVGTVVTISLPCEQATAKRESSPLSTGGEFVAQAAL